MWEDDHDGLDPAELGAELGDRIWRDARRAEREQLIRGLLEAKARASLHPLSEGQLLAAVGRDLKDSNSEIGRDELEYALEDLLTDSRLSHDRLGRLLGPAPPSLSTVAFWAARAELLTNELAESSASD